MATRILMINTIILVSLFGYMQDAEASCNIYKDIANHDYFFRDDTVVQKFLEKYPDATSSYGGIDESGPPQSSVFYEYDSEIYASLLIRIVEGANTELCLVPVTYTVKHMGLENNTEIRNSYYETGDVLDFLDHVKPTQKNYPSPLKQIKSGVSLVDVKCNEGKHLAYKSNRMGAACVTEETLNELWNRGWSTMRFYTDADTSSHALCNNYEGKWHPEHEGCRGDHLSDLQCSLMGGSFVDGLKICYNGICPENKTYRLCVADSEFQKKN